VQLLQTARAGRSLGGGLVTRDPVYRAPTSIRGRLFCALFLLASNALAQGADVYFNIPAQPADAALREFARQSGYQILFSYAQVAGRSAPAVRGRYSPEEAVALLSGGLGLEVVFVDIRTIALSPSPQLPTTGATLDSANEEESALGRSHAPVVKDLLAPLEEVIVTAQKREEAVQRVPVAIDVIPDDMLLRDSIRDVRDLQKVSTKLEIDSNAAQATAIGLRGLQQNGFAPTDDTLVAVHLDGAYLSSFWGMNGLMFDLERVEVVAGPQGTLYGRNTAAGAVNLITRRPDRVFSADASLEFGSAGTRRLAGGVSIPVGETLSLRLAGQGFSRDALFTDGSAAEDYWGLRLSGVWSPSARDELHFTADYAGLGGTNNAATLYGVNGNARLADGTVPTSVTQYLDNPTLRDAYDNLPYVSQRNLVFFGRNTQTNRGVMADYSHHFDGASATLQFSHRNVEGVARSPTRVPTQYSGALLPNAVTSDSLELRLASARGAGFEWVAGLFYMRAENLGWNATPLSDNSPDPVTQVDVAWCPCSSGYFPNSGNMYSYAAFGQATWTPAAYSRLHLTGGLRYTHDWKDATLGYWATTAQGAQPIIAFGVPDMSPAVRALFAGVRDIAEGDSDRTWDGIQYRAALEFDFAPASMVYGSVATGYKSGGLTYGTTPVLKPESLLAFEIGTKNRLLGNTLELNLSGWWYEDSNLEVNVQRPVGFSFQLPNGTYQDSAPSTASVGMVHLAGISADVIWNMTGQDRLGVSLTYVHSRIEQGEESSLAGEPVRVFNVGERIGDAPTWNLVARYGHQYRLANGAGVEPMAKYRWQSSKYDAGLYREQPYFVDNRSPLESTIPARGIIDFSVRFTPPRGHWGVTGYVNNASDTLDIRGLAYNANPANAATTYGHTTATLGEPRLIGVILDASFR
jgi:iron complex outermembrane recepter protein